MVWIFDAAKGVWVQKVVYTPEAQWELEGVAEVNPPRTYYNVTPTYQCAILRVADAKLELTRARWGFSGGAGMGHNAKMENLRRVPRWRAAYGRNHCIVVADGFYEWDTSGKQKQPYFIHRRDGQPLAMAGLVRSEPETEATIVTCPANDVVGKLHDRMPVILEPENVRRWLQPEGPDGVAELLAPAGDVLVSHPVCPDVNKSTNSWPELLEPYKVPGGAQERLF